MSTALKVASMSVTFFFTAAAKFLRCHSRILGVSGRFIGMFWHGGETM